MENNSGENSEKLSLIPSIAMQIILSAWNRYPAPTLEPKLFSLVSPRALYSVFELQASWRFASNRSLSIDQLAVRLLFELGQKYDSGKNSAYCAGKIRTLATPVYKLPHC